MKSKGNINYSCLIFSLPAVSCNFIFFFCTDPCASRNLIEKITENSELHFAGEPPFIKISLCTCQIRLKLVIIISRLEIFVPILAKFCVPSFQSLISSSIARSFGSHFRSRVLVRIWPFAEE